MHDDINADASAANARSDQNADRPADTPRRDSDTRSDRPDGDGRGGSSRGGRSRSRGGRGRRGRDQEPDRERGHGRSGDSYDDGFGDDGELAQAQSAHTPPPMDGWEPPLIAPADGKERFCDFMIPREVLRATVDLGFEYATPIQAKSLPIALQGHDVTGRAQTGTGKTAAFLIAALTHMVENPKPNRRPGSARVLVLAPTRELALQIGKDANNLSKYLPVHNLVCFGGMNHREQKRALQAPVDILAGTPGRILDYMSTGHLDLSQTEILVIDEADRMLDMGFIPDVRRIVARMPAAGKRQTMFYSATFDQSIMRLVHRWLQDPVAVEIEHETMVTDLVEEIFFSVPNAQKLNLLLWLIANDGVERMMIFGNRKDTTNDLTRTLRHYDVAVELLSGDVPQKTRLNVLERFREGTTKVIVATDVAARGIHVDAVSHVINWDLPYEPEDYVHRIGRTGRAGEKGKAISFADEYGSYVILELEEFIGRQIACDHPTAAMLEAPDKAPPPSEDRGGGYGRHGDRGRRSGRSGGHGRRGRGPDRR